MTIMDRRPFSKEHVPFSVAAAIVFEQTTGTRLKMATDSGEAFDRTGLAIAQLVPLYVLDLETHIPRLLAAEELLDAQVLRGATELTASDGTTHRELTVIRQDMRLAIALLQVSRAGF
jgi:hypothetical protein